MEDIYTQPSLIRTGLSRLGDCDHQKKKDKTPFDLDISKALGLMCFVLYESYGRCRGYSPKVTGSNPKPTDFETSKTDKIQDIVKNWDYQVQMDSISEVEEADGPFVAVFYSLKKRFIVVSFKGTTPEDYGEWLVISNHIFDLSDRCYFPQSRRSQIRFWKNSRGILPFFIPKIQKSSLQRYRAR